MDSCFKKGQLNFRHRLKFRYKLLVSFFVCKNTLLQKYLLKKDLLQLLMYTIYS